MTISEACQLWIEQRIEEELDDKKNTGKSLRQIGKELAIEVEKIFHVVINSETLKSRALRFQQKQAGSNEPPTVTIQSDDEILDNQDETVTVTHGGKRDGAGRPIKHPPPKIDKTKIISDSFREAYEAFFREIREAKRFHWKSTSKEAALECVEILHQVITIK